MEIIATGGFDSKIIVWDISSGDKVVSLEGHTDFVMCLGFSSCGRLLVSGSDDGTIILWDCETWTRMQTFPGLTRTVTSVSFSNAGDRIASTSGDGIVRVWSVARNMEELKIRTAAVILSVCFNNRGDLIAVAYDVYVNIYDAHTGELKQKFEGSMNTVRFSQDGCILASASGDKTIKLLDAVSGTVIRELQGHSAQVSQVCFDADASRIVSSSYDKTARVWDVSSGECLLTLSGHKDWVNSCCFSEDRSKVITGSQDGSVKVWDSCTGEVLKTLNGKIGPVFPVAFRPSAAQSYI